jgi:protein tyrosine phosphatase
VLRKLTDNIFLGPMPGTTTETVDLWTNRLSKHQVTQVICLAPAKDIKRLSPQYDAWRRNPVIRQEGALQEVGLTDFPVPDYGVPEDITAFWDLACRVWYQMIPDGAVIYVHCRAGIGRTGLFATAVMMVGGMTHTTAATTVAAAGSAAESEPQRQLLRTGPPTGLVENYRVGAGG